MLDQRQREKNARTKRMCEVKRQKVRSKTMLRLILKRKGLGIHFLTLSSRIDQGIVTGAV